MKRAAVLLLCAFLLSIVPAVGQEFAQIKTDHSICSAVFIIDTYFTAKHCVTNPAVESAIVTDVYSSGVTSDHYVEHVHTLDGIDVAMMGNNERATSRGGMTSGDGTWGSLVSKYLYSADTRFSLGRYVVIHCSGHPELPPIAGVIYDRRVTYKDTTKEQTSLMVKTLDGEVIPGCSGSAVMDVSTGKLIGIVWGGSSDNSSAAITSVDEIKEALGIPVTTTVSTKR